MAWFDRDSLPEVVEEIVQMDAAIQKAEDRMAFVTSDKEALRAYQMREMALSDWTSGINHAMREGRAEGKREGKAEGKIEIARNLKAMGLAAEQIVTATGLAPEVIEKL
jgi:predicted transposase/invertase (TIGR01784 family)